jgi:hypothetical protein
MTKRDFLAACCAAAVLASAAASSAGPSAATVMSARAGLQRGSESTNWAGYSATAPGVSFVDVTGSWVEPAVDCATSGPSTSSFWVGLGGTAHDSKALEQIGTAARCLPDGRTVHYAWHELIPNPSIPNSLPIAPGDSITAEVAADGTTITLRLTDLTNGQSFSTQATVAEPDLTSAEWIAEAPSSCSPFDPNGCSIQPLANFGTVAFNSGTATAGGHTGPISDPAWAAGVVHLVARSGEPVARTSELSADGSSFTVTWQSTGGRLKLLPLGFTTAPLAPRAGRPFTASIAVTATNPAALVDAKTTCAARIAGRPVRATLQTFAGGRASCGWQIPPAARGRVLAGSITATLRGEKIAKSFAFKIR